MKREAILEYFIMNGMQYATENMEVFDNLEGPMIYEVIRVTEGVPLYLEDHLERMRRSAQILGYELNKTDEEISMEILDLIKANHSYHLNVKLLCSGLDRQEQDFLVYFVESHYPTKEIYEKGIHTILFASERKNPNAKVVNVTLKEQVTQALEKHNAFEALLVNEEHCITEGSRSNIFFVKDGKLYTAPAGDVLLGVTRMQIIKICHQLGFEVVEEMLPQAEVPSLEGAFMTGTSVDVLPIATIDTYGLSSVKNPIIQKIAKGYLEDVETYIETRLKNNTK